MYHTGAKETGWRRQALMNTESAVCVFTPGIVSQRRQAARRLPVLPWAGRPGWL